MQNLSLNEIKSRALAFVKEHENDGYEMGDTQKFLIDFFDIFGIDRRYIDFEKRVKISEGGTTKRIDGFLAGKLLVEQKSKGEPLDDVFANQARPYLQGLKPEELPTHILVCDFERWWLYDLEKGGDHYAFTLSDLPQKTHLFGFLTGRKKVELGDEDPVNIKASKLMGGLHDTLHDNRYTGHDLEVFLVRVLFCLFAEDTQIFERRQFEDYIQNRTAPDGSDLGAKLDELFDVLNTPADQRQLTLDEELNAFPYINGKLFAERIRKTAFDRTMRERLLTCCAFDWSRISPAIFGSLFQHVMDPKKRRNMGAHYTDEKNILKVIKPLFLDALQAELATALSAKRNRKDKLEALHSKMAEMKFFDPACGCGNFLVITYRELRRLELQLLEALHAKERKGRRSLFDISEMVQLNVDQFYGIEIEEFSAKIAEVSLWLVDHQMNTLVAQAFGQHFARIPLRASANITHANALQVDWASLLPPDQCSHIIGNPPFYGYQWQTKEQKADMQSVFDGKVKMWKSLDYVSAWYEKSAEYIDGTDITVGLVSTNSITQGEQVCILWKHLIEHHGVQIHFAHETFKWDNQASGKAQVFVVIIGFGLVKPKQAVLYEYDNVKAEPHEKIVKTISPYLVAGSNVVVEHRRKPLCDVPAITLGSMPKDGGNFVLSPEQRDELLKNEPQAEPLVKMYIGSREFIRRLKRYCLWLHKADPALIKKCPTVLKRIQGVKEFRLASVAKSTRDAAEYPTLFKQINQPDSDYIMMPRVSSERRKYVPFGYMSKDVVLSDLCFSMPNATLYHFGVLTSQMHMAWMRYTCGRLKGDYRYSKDIVYNNFPWADASEAEQDKIATLAQAVLDARAQYPDSSLADLYDPLTMPPSLRRAHTKLDKAVDGLYRKAAFASDSERVELLFGLYEGLVAKEKKQK